MTMNTFCDYTADKARQDTINNAKAHNFKLETIGAITRTIQSEVSKGNYICEMDICVEPFSNEADIMWDIVYQLSSSGYKILMALDDTDMFKIKFSWS